MDTVDPVPERETLAPTFKRIEARSRAFLATLKWGAYGRASFDPFGNEISVSDQITRTIPAALERAAPGAKIDPAHVYAETDTSAWKRKRVWITDQYGERRQAYRVVRPDFARAMRALRSGEINGLVVGDLDRLARDPYDGEDLCEAAEYFGAVIISAAAADLNLNTSDGRTFARTMWNMAKKASDDTSRRVKNFHERKALNGEPVGGVRPFGYERDKRTVRKSEAKIIREWADDFLSGRSLAAIALAANEKGLPTISMEYAREGRTRVTDEWQPRAIGQILRNPRYAGWRTYKKKVVVDGDGKAVRGDWEAILDQKTHDRIVARFNDRKAGPRRPGARKYLLTGVLLCGVCHGNMYGRPLPNLKDRWAYACYNQGRVLQPHTLTIGGNAVEAFIEELILQRLGSESFDVTPAPFDGDDEIERLDRKQQEWRDEFNADRCTADEMHAEIRRLKAERKVLTDERDRWLAATARPSVSDLTPEKWTAFTDEDKAAHLPNLLEGIYVKPGVRGRNTLDPTRVVPVWVKRSGMV